MEGRLTSDLTHAPASLSQALDSPQSCEFSIEAPCGWPGLSEKGQWVVGQIQALHPACIPGLRVFESRGSPLRPESRYG